MDGNRVSDFSIDRILGPEVGSCSQKTPGPFQDLGYFQHIPCGNQRPLAPVPVPGYHGAGFGNGFFPFVAGFQQSDFRLYPTCCSQEPAPPPSLGHHGYQQAAVCAPAQQQQQQRQRTRMRTVFTDSQTKQLEQLFELTDYPAAEARAELARSVALSEETVRVWFKNRRARRKRQRSGSKVRSPSPPRSPRKDMAENIFSSFL